MKENIEKIINKTEKKYPKDELILDEYICEHCESRYEMCTCNTEKEKINTVRLIE